MSEPRIDRKAFSIGERDDDDAAEFWRNKTPQERLATAELLRRMVYGKAIDEGLQRFFEVVEREKD